MRNNKWIQVNNKKTYLFLISIPIGIILMILDGFKLLNSPTPLIADFITHCFIALLVIFICVYFFIRFNTYSHIYNPDHPRPKKKLTTI